MWKKLAYFVGGLAIIVGGGIQLLNFFMLPGCDSARVTETIRSIFSGQNLQLMALNEFKTVTDDNTRKTCQAHIETAEETGTIDYSVTWDNWDTQVHIDSVAALPRNPAAPDAAPAETPPPG
ncbi:MAG: hypothetical protein NUV72_05225 [Bauldia sp.]|nr:hypothetical protein [Bauldia sp.]